MLKVRLTGKVWFLPEDLNRKFTFKEKLASWVFGPYTTDDSTGRTVFRPYALSRKFNKDGYTHANPYLYFSYFGGIAYLWHEEDRYANFCLKTKKAENLFLSTYMDDKKFSNSLQILKKFAIEAKEDKGQ